MSTPTRGSFASDGYGRIGAWDDAAAAMLGWHGVDVVGRDVVELLATDRTTVALTTAVAGLRRGERFTGDVTLRRPDGELVVALRVEPILTSDRTVMGGLWSVVDVEARRQRDVVLRRLTGIVDATGDAVVGLSPQGVVTSWNRGAERLFGYPRREAVGRELTSLARDDRRHDVGQLHERLAAGLRVADLDTAWVRRDGTTLEGRLSLLPVTDGRGVLTGISAVVRDVTADNEAHRCAAAARTTDSLTRLPNRSEFLATVARMMSAPPAASGATVGRVAVVLADLDGFSAVNEAHGAAAGDEVLLRLAERLRRARPRNAHVARVGADRFAVTWVAGDEAEALTLARRVQDETERYFDVSGEVVHLTASIGVALSPADDAAALVAHAEAALARARALGPGRVAGFDAALLGESRLRLQFAADLASALGEDALDVHYQPIVSVADGTVVAVEALVRWRHSAYGDIPPERVVALARDTGMSLRLDVAVLRRACTDMVTLLRGGLVPAGARVAVNVSPATLAERSARASIVEALATAGLPASALSVEVTAAGPDVDSPVVRECLRQLVDLGVDVALDDFGDASSLRRLRELPVTSVKVDAAFVRRMCAEPDDLTIVASVVDVARATGVRTVAEAVEDRAQLDLLRRLGCDAAQGFLWSPPVPLRDLGRLLTKAPARRLSAADVVAPTVMAEPAEVGARHGLHRLLQLQREGASPTTIAAALNAEGYRTPHGQRWHGKTVARVVSEVVVPAVDRQAERRGVVL